MATPLMVGNAEATASNAVKYGSQAWQAFKTRSPMAGKEAALEIRKSATKLKEANTAPKQLTSNVGKTGGRNSAGRTTSFHRGGGAKRLYRRIDLKRSTSSMGVIERIEYDPNRSSRIALVRWVEGAHLHFQNKFKALEKFVPPQKILEPTTTTGRGVFPLSSLSKQGDQRKVAYSPPGLKAVYSVVPGLSNLCTSKAVGSKNTSARDVFLSAFSTQRAKTESASSPFSGSLNFPRIAVAGAKPAFFAPQMREKDEEKTAFSLSDIRKWNNHSSIWAHKMKRKAAMSWQSLEGQDSWGFAGFAESNKLKK